MALTRLTNSQLARLANWKSVAEGFDRNEESCRAESDLIEPLISHLSALSNTEVRVIEKAEIGTYYSIFVFDSSRFPIREQVGNDQFDEYRGVCIWLSLLAPFAACGRSRFHKFDPDAARLVFGSEPSISLEDVLDDPSPDNPLAQMAFSAIRQHGYTILKWSELERNLPSDIVPSEPIPGRQKSVYTLFDVLFQLGD